MRDWINHGYQGPISVPCNIEGNPGTIASDVDEFNNRKGDVVYVPLYDTVSPHAGGTKATYHIVGFAAFKVGEVKSSGADKDKDKDKEDKDKTPSEKYITGQFVRYVTVGEFGGTFDGGVRVVHLSQ